MVNLSGTRQRGYALLAVAGLLVCLLLAWGLYRKHQITQQQDRVRVAQAQAQATEAHRKDQERKALEARQAQAQQQQDALAASYKALDQAVGRWDDAVRVAGATGRIALAGPVATLQAIHRETGQIAVPPCLDQGKAALVKSMESTVDGFVIFMRNDLKLGDVLAGASFEEARKARQDYDQGRGQCPQ